MDNNQIEALNGQLFQEAMSAIKNGGTGLPEVRQILIDTIGPGGDVPLGDLFDFAVASAYGVAMFNLENQGHLMMLEDGTIVVTQDTEET